ncbi:helix-turn-helix transcriptional regulator [Xanthobacter variabilis]|uniref:helix-turn-helix transcriptional regulator n=1 Tax=Xanthobacter variabilis TaxID=3119932 RepID=UPI003727F0A1
MTDNAVKPSRFLRRAEVDAMTGLSRAVREAMEREGRFPRRIYLSARTVAWDEAEVVEWMASRRAARVA